MDMDDTRYPLMDSQTDSSSRQCWIVLQYTCEPRGLFNRPISFPLDVCPVDGLLGHVVALFLILWGCYILFFIVTILIYFLINSVPYFLCIFPSTFFFIFRLSILFTFQIFCTFRKLLDFLILALLTSNRYEKHIILDFIYIFLMIVILRILLYICYIFFWEMPTKVFNTF